MNGRDSQVWTWAQRCVLLLVFGAAWRWPTLHQANYLQFASGHLSYSDVVAFHSVGIAAAHHVPYLQDNIEYPVLTGFTVWLTGFAPGVEGYYLANAVLLCGCLLACFILLARLGLPGLVERYALAPGLAMYGVLNWDALGLLGLVAALYCTCRSRLGWAGAWLAMGASAKLFPAFVFPVLLAHSMRTPDSPGGFQWPPATRSLRRSPAAIHLLAGFVTVTLVLNLPIAILNWRGWSYFLGFQANRGMNPDAIWSNLPGVSEHLASTLFAGLFVSGLAWITVSVWRGGRWEAGALLSLLVFLLFTKDYSPQYDLWILPLLALLACPLRVWLIFVIADFIYYAATFFFYFVYAGGRVGISLPIAGDLLGAAVWGRELALVVLFVWGWTRYRRATLAAGQASSANSRAMAPAACAGVALCRYLGPEVDGVGG